MTKFNAHDITTFQEVYNELKKIQRNNSMLPKILKILLKIPVIINF